MDGEIGRLIEWLKAQGRWERTLLIVTGDHGEEFYEHERFGHAYNHLYDEGIRVPLLLRLPGTAGGQRVVQQVSLRDLAPTLLHLVGLARPPAMLGRSLLPLVDGVRWPQPAAEAERYQSQSYTEMFGHRGSCRYRLAIRTAQQKYIYDAEQPHVKELYDLQADGGEQHNLLALATDAAERRELDRLRLAHMAGVLPEIFTAEPVTWGEVGDDPAVVERLQALGYLE